MNKRRSDEATKRRSGLCAGMLLCLGLALSGAGCSRELAGCPFHDEFVMHPVDTTTASAEGVHAANAAAAIRVREFSPKEVSPYDGAVTHAPLYFEDPFEEKGSDDGQFAWTGEDYLQWWYWRGRFLVNEILSPLSVVVTPPWMVMVSDGKPSRKVFGSMHDAQPWVKPASGAAESASETGG